MTQLYRVIRDVQSRFGFALNAKAQLQRTVRKIRKKPFEAEFHLLSKFAANGRCILDIGANRGQSIDAIRMFHKDTEIHAFEPNGLLSKALSARYAKDPSLTVHNKGLGADTLEAQLYIPFYRNFMYDGLASFSKAEAEGWLNAETLWNFKPKLLTLEEELCSIVQLDMLALDPCFVKIDVQGFEKAVLKGGEKTLQSSEPVILLENNPEADQHLIDLGWTKFGLLEGKLQENSIGDNNTVYLKKSNPQHQQLISESWH